MILHHYDGSPFSEKIRALLGYKNLAWQSVDIPVIMPRPDLMPLSGGYRRTPIFQIGADVYCDTALIARLIDRLAPDNTIYPEQSLAASTAVAAWMDSNLFRLAVSMVFQPRALATSELFSNPTMAAAFMKDRAQLTEGAGSLAIDQTVAIPAFFSQLRKLDQQLAHAPFLFGSEPTIADFSTYHCCWFVYRVEVLQEDFAPYPNVLEWLARMRAFGHGNSTVISGTQALDTALEASPENLQKTTLTDLDGLSVGDAVSVVPTDYGFQPVTGSLQVSSLEEIVLRRSDERVGEVAVHFPRQGFQVTKAD
ncbi:MAG: glutathione S-transferase family protein [Halioglobus sp.]